MGGALALLHPIGFAEPFGLSVAEAMMTGAPVIAFNLGSMPELIEEGRTGFLVGDVAEAVSAVRKISGLMRGYVAERARKRFSVARMVEGYLEVYSKLTNPDSFRG